MLNNCDDDDVKQILVSLEEALDVLKNIGTVNIKTLGQQLESINNSIDWLCLTSLGMYNESASVLSTQLKPLAARMKIGQREKRTVDNCISNIETLIDYLENEYFEGQEDGDEEEEEEEENTVHVTMFPNNKYLNLSTRSQFPDVKTKFRELSLIYHPDKCPNDKTPGMTKEQCEEEFKTLRNEYENIKNNLGISGGKRKSRKNKTKKGLKLRKKYSTRRSRKQLKRKQLKRKQTKSKRRNRK